MQIYDLIMITVLLAAMVFGAWKGFVWQLASLASLVVSYFVALRFSSDLAPYLSGEEPLNRFMAMLLIYVGCGLIIWILFRMLSGLIDRVKLKEFDRQMGALTGLAKGGLLCIAITFFAVSLSGDNVSYVRFCAVFKLVLATFCLNALFPYPGSNDSEWRCEWCGWNLGWRRGWRRAGSVWGDRIGRLRHRGRRRSGTVF